VKFDIVQNFTSKHNILIFFLTINHSFFYEIHFSETFFDEIFSFLTINHHSFYVRHFVEAFNGTKVKFDMVQDFHFKTP